MNLDEAGRPLSFQEKVGWEKGEISPDVEYLWYKRNFPFASPLTIERNTISTTGKRFSGKEVPRI
ncbi:hypothetical protein CHM34_15045 [Paludifilum halophilum]|uniref:Uncharacterized protein n=1 Tax=Paludifilum halophilum TaxID=1642702 RepID=A0A235B4T3_9BACL|nr:hypothetical protein CHM34_15045 [Paludifilum halophilum]